MSPFEAHTEAAARTRQLIQMADGAHATPAEVRSNLTRYVVALGIATIALFGFDAWSSWFLDHDPAAREFFASSKFTLIVLMGGAFSLFVCWIVVAALVFESDSPSGRSVPEDHV